MEGGSVVFAGRRKGVCEAGYAIAGIVLCIQSIWDMKKKKIPLIVSITAGIIGIVLCMFLERELMSIFTALVPGVVCLICGKVSGEAVGYGDGIVLIVMGFYYSLEQLIIICMTAFGTAGIVGIVLLLIFKKRGNYEIPFVPFLLIGWSVERVFFVGGW